MFKKHIYLFKIVGTETQYLNSFCVSNGKKFVAHVYLQNISFLRRELHRYNKNINKINIL